MNKIISGLFTMSCIVALSSNEAAAQAIDYVIPASERTVSTTASTNVPLGVTTATYQNFTETFKGASDVRWSTKSEHTLVYFKENGVFAIGSYSSKGKLEHVIRYYYKEQAPAKYVNIMRRNGYFMAVTLVSEISVNHTRSAFVKMENEDKVVTVQVFSDGQINEVENFNRSK